MDHLSGLRQAAESIDPTEEKQEPPRRHNRRNQVREMNRRCLGASQQGQLKHVEMMQSIETCDLLCSRFNGIILWLRTVCSQPLACRIFKSLSDRAFSVSHNLRMHFH